MIHLIYTILFSMSLFASRECALIQLRGSFTFKEHKGVITINKGSMSEVMYEIQPDQLFKFSAYNNNQISLLGVIDQNSVIRIVDVKEVNSDPLLVNETLKVVKMREPCK